MAALIVLVVIGSSMGGEYWCDGNFHRFQIPDDYRGGGCSRIIPGWQVVFPWNWDRMDMICLGMCLESPIWSPPS